MLHLHANHKSLTHWSYAQNCSHSLDSLKNWLLLLAWLILYCGGRKVNTLLTFPDSWTFHTFLAPSINNKSVSQGPITEALRNFRSGITKGNTTDTMIADLQPLIGPEWLMCQAWSIPQHWLPLCILHYCGSNHTKQNFLQNIHGWMLWTYNFVACHY